MKRSPAHWILLALAGGAVAGFLLFGLFVSPSEDGHGTHEKLGLPPFRAWQTTFGGPNTGTIVFVTEYDDAGTWVQNSGKLQGSAAGVFLIALGFALRYWRRGG